MKIGLIADIHGNLPALSKVLDELHKHKVEVILCAGDLVCYGAHPNRVISTLVAAGIPSVTGNYDTAVGWGLPTASSKLSSPLTQPIKQRALEWSKQRVTSNHCRYLRGLPWTMHYRFGEVNLQVLHAGLQHLDEWYAPDDHQKLQQLVNQTSTDILVCGHTHLPFTRTVAGKDRRNTLIINPGAVGRALDGDNRAAYAVFDSAQGVAELFRVKYDINLTIRAILNSDMPAEIADLIFYAVRRVEDLTPTKKRVLT